MRAGITARACTLDEYFDRSVAAFMCLDVGNEPVSEILHSLDIRVHAAKTAAASHSTYVGLARRSPSPFPQSNSPFPMALPTAHSPAPPPRLPFDVLEEVVGHLVTDREGNSGRFVDPEWRVTIPTLKACSLVCRDLLQCSRKYLFRDLSLRSAEELEGFIASRENISWLSDISTLWVHGFDWDQSWISAIPLSLFPFLHLKEIKLQGVDLRVIHPSAYKAFRLRGPQRWTFEDTTYSRYSHITQLLPPNTASLVVIDKSGLGVDRDLGRASFDHLRGPFTVDWPRLQMCHTLTLGSHFSPHSSFTFYAPAPPGKYYSARITYMRNLSRLFQHCIRQGRVNQFTLGLDLYQHDHRSQLRMVHERAKNTLIIEIRASSLSCIATYPIAQALQQLRGAFFHSIRIVICKEYPGSVRFPPEVNPPLLDMQVLAARWKSVDAALARTNFQDFRFQCCLEPHVLPDEYTCTNELIGGLLPTFTSAVSLDGPACKSCHGMDSGCAYHRATAVGRSPRFSTAVLQRIVGYLLPGSANDPHGEKVNARALSACSLVSRELLDCCRRHRFRAVVLRSEMDLSMLTALLKATSRLSDCVEHLIVRSQCVPDLASQQWVSSIPSHLLPLQNLRRYTMEGVDLRTIRPSARQAFSLHGPKEWSLLEVKYTKYAQITELLPASTTYLSIHEPRDPLGINKAPLYPGPLSFRHVQGPLKVEWVSSFKHRESLARNLDGNMVPRAGFNIFMDALAIDHSVQNEDVAVIGCVRKAFENAAGIVDSDNLCLQYLSQQFRVNYAMRRITENGTMSLVLVMDIRKFGSIATLHLAELLHHAASKTFDHLLLCWRPNNSGVLGTKHQDARSALGKHRRSTGNCQLFQHPLPRLPMLLRSAYSAHRIHMHESDHWRPPTQVYFATSLRSLGAKLRGLKLGNITTFHISELLHHAASEVPDSFLVNLDASTTSDLRENSSSSSPNVKILVSL
ncbi:hypothetical protein EIP91_007496 [Steccherinum ochraceum]|uniref:Uncharacterized protein n=1 Tax=Steccherinum ochraceum TaxID=92696 RepID=A0A4R0RIE7_9APHY|nr:hypothetical protein EIP91_007496 [Steccherinum ochraceum]